MRLAFLPPPARGCAVALSLFALSACVVSRPIRPTRASGAAARVATAPPPVAAEAAATAWRAAGRSAEGRTIELVELGRGARRVLWVGGIHGDEREGSVATEALPRAFAAAEGLADEVTLTLVRDVNPDGSAAGRRANSRGVDLNRNFPATSFKATPATGKEPLDQPEARLLHDLILDLKPHLVVVCHASSRGPFINFDGPAEPLAAQFAGLSGYPLVRSDELHRTPGSLGSWLGVDRRVPILTLEFRRGEDPARGWEQTERAVLAVLRGEG